MKNPWPLRFRHRRPVRLDVQAKPFFFQVVP
jgi:hypothetical protein